MSQLEFKIEYKIDKESITGETNVVIIKTL